MGDGGVKLLLEGMEKTMHILHLYVLLIAEKIVSYCGIQLGVATHFRVTDIFQRVAKKLDEEMFNVVKVQTSKAWEVPFPATWQAVLAKIFLTCFTLINIGAPHSVASYWRGAKVTLRYKLGTPSKKSVSTMDAVP